MIDVHVHIAVHLEIQGRINYNDPLMILGEDKIYRIETAEKGLKIVYGDYALTIRLEHRVVDSTTIIEIVAETTRMGLVKLAEKVDNLVGRVLRLVI